MFGQPSVKPWHFDAVGQTEAVNRLLYVAETCEALSVLEGPYGTGKTTVLRQTAEQLSREEWRVVNVNLASLDCRAALWHLAGTLSIASDSDAATSEVTMLVREELLARVDCGHRMAILIDDADLARPDASVVLHLLTAISEASEQRISILAAVENPLSVRLQKRNPLSVALQPLPPDESIRFAIAFLRQQDCSVERITETGRRAMADQATGLPAQLIRLCQIIHVYMSMHVGPINAAVVHEAAGELLPPHAA